MMKYPEIHWKCTKVKALSIKMQDGYFRVSALCDLTLFYVKILTCKVTVAITFV